MTLKITSTQGVQRNVIYCQQILLFRTKVTRISINKLIMIIIKVIMTMMFINNDHDYVKERNTMTMTMTKIK